MHFCGIDVAFSKCNSGLLITLAVWYNRNILELKFFLRILFYFTTNSSLHTINKTYVNENVDRLEVSNYKQYCQFRQHTAVLLKVCSKIKNEADASNPSNL